MGPRLVASRRKSLVMPVHSNCSMLLRMSPRGSIASSTNTANFAPRERASRPRAPVPAKRSSTVASFRVNFSQSFSGSSAELSFMP